MDDLEFFKHQVSELNSENLNLKSDLAFLKGKIEVYERFLRSRGFIKEDEDIGKTTRLLRKHNKIDIIKRY